MKKILHFKLRWLVYLILRRYRPIIIGVTGSMGKTSAKEAIYTVLRSKIKVGASQKNYNNEIGVPLSIIGVESGGRSLWSWLLVFAHAWHLLIFKDKNYPKALVLEMGVDRPGDMTYLTKIAPPNIGVVTGVSYSHLEYFGSVINIKKEKQVLVERLASQGLAVLNYDNELSQEMSQVSRARVLTYGLKKGADLQAQDIVFNFTKDKYELMGVNFKLNYRGSIVPVFMPQVMTESAIYAALAAAAVGLQFNFNLVELSQALANFATPKGRMRILPGLKQSFIIDDSYNSSPEAAQLAISVLDRIKVDASAKKYAVLGDMLELGPYTEEGHQLLGTKIAGSSISYLVTVGERARDIIRGAKGAGFNENATAVFGQTTLAGAFLRERIGPGDVILVKGSQGMRMEKIIKDIMAEPDKAPELLVRQDSKWLAQ